MSEFILAVRKHQTLGYLVSAYLAESTSQNFMRIVDSLGMSAAESSELTDNQKHILKMIDVFSEQQLSAIFNRKGVPAHSFIQNIDNETLETRIRPFIEGKLVKIFELIRDTNTRIFFRSGNQQTLHPEDELTLNTEPAKTVFNITKHEEGTRYFLSVKHRNRSMKLSDKPVYLLTNQPCILIIEAEIFFFEDIDAKKLRPFLTKEYIHIPKSAEKKWYETFASKAVKLYDVNAQGFDIKSVTTIKKAVIVLENSWQNLYTFFIKFQYNDKFFEGNNPIESLTDFNETDFSFVKTERDKNWESEICNYLISNGLTRNSEANFLIPNTFIAPEFQHSATIYFLNNTPTIFDRDDIHFTQKFFNKTYFTKQISLEMRTTENRDWFDIEAIVTFGSYEFPFIKLRDNILNRTPEFLLPNGTTALIPTEWFAKYEGLFMFSKHENDRLKLKRHHFKLLQDNDLKSRNKLFEIEIPENFQTQVPSEIRAELRPYQKDGFRWLSLLRENNLGGCLADDMGLGKTLQTITLLQDTVENRKRNALPRKPSLIVMPVSLIHNWEFEIMKFSPFLRVLKYWGGKRSEKFDEFGNFDVILTGYGVVRNDIELLQCYEFLYIILDESQYIKNPESKVYQSVMQLNSEHRLVLTGTPIENSLTDLWAQMNFINEGLLGSKEFFKQNFTTYIEKDLENSRSAQLKNIIKPFFLRRKKDEVAKDLPELTEQLIYCRMTEAQKKLYDSEKSKIRNTLIGVETVSKKERSILIIKALMRLRQIANHPKLVQPDYEADSGKFENVIGAVENLISENHKVLIFSSFVKHLNLFARHFDAQNTSYAMLTGATKDRAGVVHEFQENPNTKLFLISIKSGGTGLNLTQADYVFILDPWWNPATEAQAVNRAHRIGQNKHVMVYRFITPKTVEEKIRKLQADKLRISDMFITSNNPLAQLSENEIEQLFE